MQSKKTQLGYSMVEVLVAVAVLLIAIVGPMTIASQGIKSASFTLEQNTAFFLAQEGIEAVHNLKNWYAVRDLTEGGSDALKPSTDVSWDWISDELSGSGPCLSSVANTDGASCSFGIDWRDNTLEDNLTTGRCEDPSGAHRYSNCNLYLDETDSRAKYSHQSAGGTLSPYNRVVTVIRQSAYVIEVISEVSWESAIFPGQTQTVTLRTMMYDSNYEQP